MTNPNRRAVLGGLAFAATGLSSSQTFAAANDGHAAGYDVAPAADHLAVIPRRTGDAMKFTAALDAGPIKATSGGWARDITTRTLPIATAIAGAHLYLNAGGVREMHWHDSAEWAYILAGHCQVTVVDPRAKPKSRTTGRAISGTSRRDTVTQFRRSGPSPATRFWLSTTGSMRSTARSA